VTCAGSRGKHKDLILARDQLGSQQLVIPTLHLSQSALPAGSWQPKGSVGPLLLAQWQLC